MPRRQLKKFNEETESDSSDDMSSSAEASEEESVSEVSVEHKKSKYKICKFCNGNGKRRAAKKRPNTRQPLPKKRGKVEAVTKAVPWNSSDETSSDSSNDKKVLKAQKKKKPIMKNKKVIAKKPKKERDNKKRGFKCHADTDTEDGNVPQDSSSSGDATTMKINEYESLLSSLGDKAYLASDSTLRALRQPTSDPVEQNRRAVLYDIAVQPHIRMVQEDDDTANLPIVYSDCGTRVRRVDAAVQTEEAIAGPATETISSNEGSGELPLVYSEHSSSAHSEIQQQEFNQPNARARLSILGPAEVQAILLEDLRENEPQFEEEQINGDNIHVDLVDHEEEILRQLATVEPSPAAVAVMARATTDYQAGGDGLHIVLGQPGSMAIIVRPGVPGEQIEVDPANNEPMEDNPSM